MAKIIVNNPKQVINGGAKKYYFKVKGLGGLKGDKGDKGDTGAQGLAGANGADGFSPIATVTPTDTGATISVTDLNGTTTANITNGTDGQNGANGQNGADGFSPIATVTQTSTGATISITDAQGTTTADIANGTGSNAPIATTSVAGIVKPDGTTITVSPDGTISSNAEYTLPPATDTTLGAIKVGSNLSITADGTLSADAQQVTLYSSTGQNTDGAMTQKATTDALTLKADSSSLAPVATSGDYNDLNNLPTPPTVNNGALTIQQNGKTLGTFTANSSDNKTVNIQAITAATVAPAEKVGAITTNMIANRAVTNAKIDFSTFIKTGTVQVEYQANGTGGGFVNVTFDTPFTHTPVVFAQDVLGNGSVSSLTVSDVTATGFRVLARTTNNSSAGKGTVNWLAFSQQG